MTPTDEALRDVRKYQHDRLSPERKGIVTASLAPKIVHGTDDEHYQLWLELTGQAEPPDLSGVFAVQWGKHNEQFILDWTERTTQCEITERQRWCRHPRLPLGATIDGYRPFDGAVVEAKVLGPFLEARTNTGRPGFLDYYAPQVIVQMYCRPADRGYLCVQQGNSAPQLYEVERDRDYEMEIMQRIELFSAHVRNRTAPSSPPPAPTPPEHWRSVDLAAESDENWVHEIKTHLGNWRNTLPYARIHEQSKINVKAMLPDDVGRATLDTIVIRRSRAGSVTITEK